MDVWAIIIIASIAVSGLVMIIGPLIELKGKILFLEPKTPPKTSRRWGMLLMLIGAIIFVIGLVLRPVLSSGIVTPIVLIGFALWFIAGVIALIRNEMLKFLVSPSEHSERNVENGEGENRESAYKRL